MGAASWTTTIPKRAMVAGLLAIGLMLAGCASTARVAYTATEQATAVVPNIPYARFWSDDYDAIGAALSARQTTLPSEQFSMLALSGGGANGAFGAGFLTGWSEAGTRPVFDVVTGVSVGALIAPFAFLGSDHDPALRKMFNGGDTKDLLEFVGLQALFSAGAFSSAPLRKLVVKYVDRSLLNEIAEQYEAGRWLLVATTNVDSQRTAIWNLGAIASSPDPSALELFRTVLLASASIPGVFAPEIISVQAEGRRIGELHIDGGVTSNLVLVPEALLASQSSARLGRNPQFYAIINGKLGPEFEVTESNLVSVIERSFETTMKANTTNQLLATRGYLRNRTGQLHIAAMAPDYPVAALTDFSAKNLRPLFAAGYAQGKKDERWIADPFGN